MKVPALIILLTALSGCKPKTAPTAIRIRNASDRDFQAVVVGGAKFGDIKAGAATHYQIVEVAMPITDASLLVGSNRLRFTPIDYVGYKPLDKGRFTYLLSIERGKLQIRSEKDE
jgi:hypothetical protein